ncbi:MAG: hypothetical protein AAGF83_12000 [Cyanobacteria bacterium P01_G01_bin.67]
MLKGVYLTLMMGRIVPEPVPLQVVEALKNVQVSISSSQRSGFQLTLNVGQRSLINRELLPSGYFDTLNRVIIIATVKGNPNVLMDGVIARIELAPSNEPGQSTLTVTGEDVTRIMDLVDISGVPYPAMSAEARVALILAKYTATYGIIPKVIPSIFVNVNLPTAKIEGHQGTDLQYINQLAANVGYVFYVEPGPKPGANVAYWGPEIKSGLPQPALTIDSDASTNVESLSFNFDGFAKTKYVALIQEPTTKISIPIPVPDINLINPTLGKNLPTSFQVKPIRDFAKYTPTQAAATLLAKTARSANVVGASGSLNVLRYGRVLKARQLVGVRGAGQLYDGLYYVNRVTHNIQQGEYKQNFTLSRNALIASNQRVTV